MAVVSRLPLIPQEINPIRYPGTEISEMMASGSEIMEESPPRPVQVVEEKMYIAVGKDIKESTSVLIWALCNAGGRKICILHVHEPAQRIPMICNQKTLYNAYKKRTKNVEIDIEEYNRMKKVDPEFYREASTLQYGKVTKHCCPSKAPRNGSCDLPSLTSSVTITSWESGKSSDRVVRCSVS